MLKIDRYKLQDLSALMVTQLSKNDFILSPKLCLLALFELQFGKRSIHFLSYASVFQLKPILFIDRAASEVRIISNFSLWNL